MQLTSLLRSPLLFLGAAFLAPAVSPAADPAASPAEKPSAPAVRPDLALIGKVLYENKMDAALGDPWKVAKGTWELTGESWKAAEKPEDQHPGVARLTQKLADFVIEYEFKLDGAKVSTLSINGPKGHMARVLVSSSTVTVQKDDSDHEGPDKAKVFARLPATFAPGSWHKVRLEMVGESLFARVDDLTAWGSDPSFKQERQAGLTVGGSSVSFRNFKISEATLNPDWKNPPMPEVKPKPKAKSNP